MNTYLSDKMITLNLLSCEKSINGIVKNLHMLIEWMAVLSDHPTCVDGYCERNSSILITMSYSRWVLKVKVLTQNQVQRVFNLWVSHVTHSNSKNTGKTAKNEFWWEELFGMSSYIYHCFKNFTPDIFYYWHSPQKHVLELVTSKNKVRIIKSTRSSSGWVLK